MTSAERTAQTPTLADLRRFAVARSLFPPTTLRRAIERFGFVQADPIRAPARAQDLTLRHRVNQYRAGELDRRYATLAIEEDVFVNYGFVTHAVQSLMHPRTGTAHAAGPRGGRAQAVLAFVEERESVHPREVDAHFSHGRVTNYWGGSSNATTHLLNAMHYAGLLRVARREGGVRIYTPRAHEPGPTQAAERRARVDALVDVVVRKYAPLPALSLARLVSRLRYAVPQWRADLKPALTRARARLSRARVDGVEWYWPAGEALLLEPPEETVRFLAPFDPVVWDRPRFELFWGWPYRFEAYTPLAKRQRGYYALPLLWRDRVIGWANVSLSDGAVRVAIGYVAGQPPRDRTFGRELDAERERMRVFLSDANG